MDRLIKFGTRQKNTPLAFILTISIIVGGLLGAGIFFIFTHFLESLLVFLAIGIVAFCAWLVRFLIR
jgi:hypothetical protein